MEEYTAVVVPADNKKGFVIDYAYYGLWYKWNLPEADLKRTKTVVLIEGIMGLTVTAAAAAIPSWYNALSFVAYPALIAMLACFLEMFGIGQFVLAKYRTTKSNYLSANRRLRVYPIIHAVAAFTATLGGFYYLFKYGWSMPGILVTLLYGLAGVASCLIHHRYVRIPFSTEHNDTLEHVRRATLGD